MSALSLADNAYALRFLKLLVTPWEKTSAYEEGLIDEKGKRKKDVKIKTKAQKEAYTVFHRLVYNVKRLVGNSTPTSLASALYLIKEETNLTDEELNAILTQALGDDWSVSEINESFFVKESMLAKGTYVLQHDIVAPSTGEPIAKKGTKVVAEDYRPSVDVVMGYNVFEVHHAATNQKVFITSRDITQ